MKKFKVDWLHYQNHIDEKHLNEALHGAVHVETYTEPASGLEKCKDKTLIIFAFYPDALKKNEQTIGATEDVEKPDLELIKESLDFVSERLLKGTCKRLVEYIEYLED